MNEALIEKYPYYAYGILQALRNPDTPADRRQRLTAMLMLNVGRQDALREILGLNSSSLTDFYPDQHPETPSTTDTIDTFLQHFGGAETYVPGQTPYPGLQDPPQADSNEMMADATASAIDAFLQAVPPPQPKKTAPQPQPDAPAAQTETTPTSTAVPETTTDKTPEKEKPTETLTEGFARILVKNGNYQQALAIIEELNLKNPEKSIYFADQIRFLKKLIINSKHSKPV